MRAITLRVLIACGLAAFAACQSIPDVKFYADPVDGGAGTDGSTTIETDADTGEASSGGGTDAGVVDPPPEYSCPDTPPTGGVCCGTIACLGCSNDTFCAACACAEGQVCCRQGGSAKADCRPPAQCHR